MILRGCPVIPLLLLRHLHSGLWRSPWRPSTAVPRDVSSCLWPGVTHRRSEAGSGSSPGGKIEEGEQPVSAALREVAEEVGLGADALITDPQAVMVVDHSDPEVAREKSIRLHAFLAEVKPTAMPEALGASEVRWVSLDRLADFEWPKANAPINERLLEILR